MSSRDREIVRSLAKQVRDLANSEENERRRRRWRDVNGLRRPDRAPVWCRPVGAWSELLPESELVCEDELCRSVERRLRQHLIKHDIGDDSIIEPWWSVPAVLDVDPPNVWGVDVRYLRPGEEGGAWDYEWTRMAIEVAERYA